MLIYLIDTRISKNCKKVLWFKIFPNDDERKICHRDGLDSSIGEFEEAVDWNLRNFVAMLIV